MEEVSVGLVLREFVSFFIIGGEIRKSPFSSLFIRAQVVIFQLKSS